VKDRPRRRGGPSGAPSRTVLAIGIAVVAVYVASAWFSGQLSPLARRPLLDGLVPPAPYRWVDPPPELASTNVEPTSVTTVVKLGNRGSATAIVSTDDAQVTLVLPRGAFGNARQQQSVRVRIEPLPPDAVEPPEPPLRILGNVYRLRGNYVPSGDAAPFQSVGARVVLVYPFISTDHWQHAVVVSPDGESWTSVETNDFRGIQQADGPIDALGYVAVAQTGIRASPSPAPTVDGGVDVATVAIIAGLVALAAGAAWAVRPARGSSKRRPVGSRKRTDPRRRRDEQTHGRRRSSRPGKGAARDSRPNRSPNTRTD
jgi:hypothetical protein